MRRVGPLVLALVAVVAAGCADEEPTDFTAENRGGFMQACTRPLDDPQLVTEVCRCVFAAVEGELAFDRFRTIEQELRADPERELPVQVLDIVADCVIEVAEL